MDYKPIPSFECKPGCSDCCGPVPWSYEEERRIHAWLAERGRRPLKAKSLDCPYIEAGRCSIYEVRPFLCRLYGTVEGMQCPHGCRPDNLLTSKQERALLVAYAAEMNHGVRQAAHDLATLGTA